MVEAERKPLVLSLRPTYALILLALSGLWLCAVLVPYLNSVISPDQDFRDIVLALEGRRTAPPGSEPMVQQTIATAGPMKRAIQIAYYSGGSVAIHTSGSPTTRKMKVSQASYMTWFQKPGQPAVVGITRYEDDAGQKTYGINAGDPLTMMQGYALQRCLLSFHFSSHANKARARFRPNGAAALAEQVYSHPCPQILSKLQTAARVQLPSRAQEARLHS